MGHCDWWIHSGQSENEFPNSSLMTSVREQETLILFFMQFHKLVFLLRNSNSRKIKTEDFCGSIYNSNWIRNAFCSFSFCWSLFDGNDGKYKKGETEVSYKILHGIYSVKHVLERSKLKISHIVWAEKKYFTFFYHCIYIRTFWKE